MLDEYSPDDAWRFQRESGIPAVQKGNEIRFDSCPYCKGGKNHDRGTFAIHLPTGQFNCLRSSCGAKGNMHILARDFTWFDLRRGGNTYNQPKKQYRTFKKMHPIESKPAAIKILEARGISADITKEYEITTQTEHENILAMPFRDENGDVPFIKYRKADYNPKIDKNKEWCQAGGKPILFGMHQCNLNNKTLVLTEGQIDSLSVAEAGIENAVSVPTGANGFTWIPHCWKWLQNFETLIVFGDFENGKMTLLDEMKKRFPGVVKAVRQQDYKGCKDANELLQKYGKEAVKQAVNNAKRAAIDRVKEIADIQAVDLFSLPKISTGITGIDKVLSGGIYLGQTVILTGKRGDGKSTLGSQILANALDNGKSVFAYSGELPDYFFKRWLDFQIAGQQNVIDRAGEAGSVNYFIPDSKVHKISEWYRGRAYLFDSHSTEDNELEHLLSTIEKAIQQYGIQLVLLDNLMTALDIGLDIDLYRAQSKFVDKLVKISKNYNVAVILVVHPRKNSLGADDNDVVSGSSDITNKVDVVMTYKRDKTLPDDERLLAISKNRLTGKLAIGAKAIKLYFDEASKRISDDQDNFRKPYGWEADSNGFMPVTDMEQMEIPFD